MNATSGGSLIRPFAALRPAPQYAAEVAAPPYDVVTTDEARLLAAGRQWSFLHISKPEIDLRPGIDAHAPEVYAKGGENMQKMIAAGVLVRDPAPCFYAYRVEMGDHVQTGVVGAGSVAAYQANRIRKHELTQPAKEDDRVRQIEAVGAQTGPVCVIHPANAAVARALQRAAAGDAAYAMTTADGVRHTLWVISDDREITDLAAAFAAMDAVYIADGHHRSAAAARVAAARGDADDAGFLVVSFPEDEVRILDYNRLVKDLNGLSRAQFLERLAAAFEIAESDRPVAPEALRSFGMYVGGRWYRLALRQAPGASARVVDTLDINLLTGHLLAPILAIGDPRDDPRIDFVGGIRGLEELVRRVDRGDWAVAFALYPTAMGDLMAVADAGQVMPPKSTWFEPKLADGLVSLVLD